jgi:hypothetical protein
MEIKVHVPEHILNSIEAQFIRMTGKMPSNKQLTRFLENDIMEVYFNNYADGLNDAIDHVA